MRVFLRSFAFIYLNIINAISHAFTNLFFTILDNINQEQIQRKNITMDTTPPHATTNHSPTHNQHPLNSLQLLLPSQPHLPSSYQHTKADKRASSNPSVNNFIQKTFMILEEKKFQSIVSWAESSDVCSQYGHVVLKQGAGRAQSKQGTESSSFKIHNIKAFEEIVLPQYFKHSNMSSFVRQLNMYNFHKVRGDKNEFQFQHDKFIRNRPDLLIEIKRKQVQSSSSIPSISLIPHEPLYNISQKIYNPQPSSNNHVSEKDSKVFEGNVQGQAKDNSSPIKKEESYGSGNNDEDMLGWRLGQLQQANRVLRKAKQSRLSVIKQMTNGNRLNISNKFNKLMMSVVSSKIQFDRLEGEPQRTDSKYNMNNLHAIIEHIMDNSPSKTFQQYLVETYQLFCITPADHQTT